MDEKVLGSLSNPIVKEVFSLQQKKYRDERSLILLEGEKLIEGALNFGLSIEKVFLLEPTQLNFDCEVYFVNQKIMEKISTTSSPPKILAVAKRPKTSGKKANELKKLILLDSIKDGGNLGTIVRTTAALGIDGILLYGDCVDIYSPKVLRATVGTIFKIPIFEVNESDLKELKKTHKFIGTIVNSNNQIKDIDFSIPHVLMFGSEASGLSEALLNLSDTNFTLKMQRDVESLNLAISVGICVWEAMK